MEKLGILPDEQKMCKYILDSILKNSENTHDAKLVYEKTHPSLNETFNQYRKNQPTNKKINKKASMYFLF